MNNCFENLQALKLDMLSKKLVIKKKNKEIKKSDKCYELSWRIRFARDSCIIRPSVDIKIVVLIGLPIYLSPTAR